MKTTALILSILSLITFSSCKCELDEDKARDQERDQRNRNTETTANSAATMQEEDSLSMQ